ncbi:hypothetical protein [Sphingomonas sp.]|uniref:hypothetical protein n=1 Tax=Sphingomonas sp. TaxID=28214 RepID=UPI003B3AB767
MTSPYRPEFEAGLVALARVGERMRARGCLLPVLVGGGAVEIYSNSAIMTGDFDLSTARQDVFEQALLAEGFIRPSGPGVATRGWIHPDLKLGFEVVSDRLLDGNADRDRVRRITIDGAGEIAVIAVEDIIADRMGQYASGTARDMFDQAKALFRLYPDADRIYMERRIREETAGDHGIDALER